MKDNDIANGEQTNVLDYVFVIVKWRRLIMCSVVVVTVASAGISVLLPEQWTAETKLLMPEDDSSPVDLSGLLGNAMPTGLRGFVGGSTTSERLLTLLDSDRMLGTIVDDFELKSVYSVLYHDEAIEILREQIETELEDDGTLNIRLTAKDPHIAADLTNGLSALLDRLNREYKRKQARDLRLFLAERMALTEKEFKLGGLKLQNFQERYGLVDIKAQTSASVDVLKGIVQELAQLEVELSVMERQLHSEHEGKRVLELKVAALKHQLNRLQGDLAMNSSNGETLTALGPPLKHLPELLLENTKLSLEVELRSEIIRFLGSKFEEAKYKEALNTPTLQVLDVAIPPRTRSGPRRTLIVTSSFAVGAMLSIVIAFLFESWNRLGRENREKMASIRQELNRS